MVPVSDRTVVLELAGEHNKLARDLMAGGVFVPGHDLPLNEDCQLILRGNGAQLHLLARVVWSNESGIGLQLENCDADMKQRIAALAAPPGQTPHPIATPTSPRPIPRVAAPPPASAADSDGAIERIDLGDDDPATQDLGETADADDADPQNGASDGKKPSNMHERLRGLTLAQQIKVAHHGEVSERIILERMYGKNVWEALLRNQRLTGPEVARIARMGSLPRPQMEIILNNGGWLQIPEVRRALLSNPRLGTDQIMRILRLVPKHELKLAALQTAYPLAVRDVAKRMLKDAGGG